MKWLRHLLSIVLLPGTVMVVVPVWLYLTQPSRPGWGLPAPWSTLPALAGVAFLGLGLTLMVAAISLFATVGQGTLAPWDPTQRLVIRGVYRYVRNPMISGVLFSLLGEAGLLGSVAVFGWFALFGLFAAVSIPLIEEPGLVTRFGDHYLLYRQNVPRWMPRLRPWTAPFDQGSSSH